MQSKLITDRWRELAWWSVLGSATLVTAIGIVVFHGSSTALDDQVWQYLLRDISWGVARPLLNFSAPPISIALLAAATGGALVARRWDLALFAVLAPSVAIAMTETILKPLVGRPLGHSPDPVVVLKVVRSVYPSGHQTIVCSTALVLFIAACHLPLRRSVLAVVAGALALWTVIAGVGLSRNLLHFPTDVIGAVGVSVGCVLGVALALDRWFEPVINYVLRRRKRRTPSTPR